MLELLKLTKLLIVNEDRNANFLKSGSRVLILGSR